MPNVVLLTSAKKPEEDIQEGVLVEMAVKELKDNWRAFSDL